MVTGAVFLSALEFIQRGWGLNWSGFARQARGLLEDIGFEEMHMARATFVYREKTKKRLVAMICLHVDDGMLMGDPRDAARRGGDVRGRVGCGV